jgi:hypothetical protein
MLPPGLGWVPGETMEGMTAPTIGNLICELQKFDPEFLITLDDDDPPGDVDEVVEFITRGFYPTYMRARQLS